MAKSKPKKKKYTPRTVHYPNIIIAMHSMGPIEIAVSNILNRGEVLEDNVGNYVYRTGEGKLESFEAGLDIYNFVIADICKNRCVNWEPKELIQLREAMLAKTGFDEELLENAMVCLENCKSVLSGVSPKELRESVAKVRAYREQQKASQNKNLVVNS